MASSSTGSKSTESKSTESKSKESKSQHVSLSPEKVCNIPMNSLLEKHGLTELDDCPLCKVAVGWHKILSSEASRPARNDKDGSKSSLPTWKKEFHQVKPL